MSIIEYAEKLGVKLYPFQRQFLQKLEKLPPGMIYYNIDYSTRAFRDLPARNNSTLESIQKWMEIAHFMMTNIVELRLCCMQNTC